MSLRRERTRAAVAASGAHQATVAFLAVHPPHTAATRLRVTQYFPHLEKAGFRCQLWTFLREGDLAGWYGPSSAARLIAAARGLLRIPSAIRLIQSADVIVVQRECLPFGPPLLERLAARRRRLVWDVDDAVWQSYTSPTAGRITRWIRTSVGKHAAVCRRADEVWAGSQTIKEWAEEHNGRVTYAPTVVDVPKARPGLPRSRRAVWVGSHSAAPFLQSVLPHLDPVEALESVVVVGGSVRSDGVAVDERPWSVDMEREVCHSARVGLYPIDLSNPYAEGKCALKAILYMAHGLPSVVTPTRSNAAVVRDGVDGLHARTPDDWRDATQRLLTDDDLWERCSQAGHARARDEYSLEIWGPRLAERLQALCGGAVTGPGGPFRVALVMPADTEAMGGVRRFADGLADALEVRCEIRTICLHPPRDARWTRRSRALAHLRGLRSLRRLVGTGAIDGIITSYHWPPAVTRRVPHIGFVHDIRGWERDRLSLRGRVRQQVMLRAWRSWRAVAVPSSHVADDVRRLLPRGRVVVVPEGLDHLGEQPNGGAPTRSRILVLGGGSEHKRQSFGTEVAEELARRHGYGVDVVGPPGETPEGDVVFRFGLSDGDLSSLYQTALLAVAPTAYEGFGLAIGEAMWFGVPVVYATDAPVAELVGPGGLAAHPDIESFIEASETVLRRRDDFSGAAERAAARYLWRTTADALLQLLCPPLGDRGQALRATGSPSS